MNLIKKLEINNDGACVYIPQNVFGLVEMVESDLIGVNYLIIDEKVGFVIQFQIGQVVGSHSIFVAMIGLIHSLALLTRNLCYLTV